MSYEKVFLILEKKSSMKKPTKKKTEEQKLIN